MLTATTIAEQNSKTETIAPALPQVPEGYFWRVTDAIFADGDTFLTRGVIYQRGQFQVQLRKRKPGIFRKNRSVFVAGESVYVRDLERYGINAAQATLRAAEQVLKERGQRIEFYTALRQIEGDYR
jgi:hypothetical protein